MTIELMLLVGLYMLSACTSSPHDVEDVASLPEIYPDYTGVTVPVEIAPLNFSMTDDEVTTVDVEIKGAKGGSLHANGAYADFDIDAWHELLKDNQGGK